uniref:Uncharacterized protein n=2 Tax=Setaria TaxID=4554 RepID=K4AHZ3_SETIT
MAFIKEIQPKITVFVAVMLKRNVQPPGPFLKHIMFHLLSGYFQGICISTFPT